MGEIPCRQTWSGRLPLEDQGRSVGAGLFIIKKKHGSKIFIIEQTIYHRQYDLADNDFWWFVFKTSAGTGPWVVIFGETICWKWWQVAAGCQDGQTPEEVVSPAHWDRHSDSDGWSNAGHTLDASYVNVSWRVCEYWNQKTKTFQSCGVRSWKTPRFVVRMDASFLVSKVVSSFLDASAFPFAALAVWSSGLSKSLHKKCWVPEIWTKESRTVRSQLGSSCLVFKKPRLVFTVRCTAFWMKISTCFKNSTCEKITGDTLQRLPWNPLIYSWFSAIDKSLCVHHGFSLRWQLWRLRHTVASIQTTPSPLRRWVTLPWKSPFDPRNFI